MLRIERTGSYEQMLQELTKDDEGLLDIVRKRTRLFQKNPNDTRLDNHELHGRMEGRFAIAITGDVRIVYRWIGKTTVRFLATGPHGAVYQKKPS